MTRRTWAVHCEDEFEYLSEHDPQALLELIQEGSLPDTLLTFALSNAGAAGKLAVPVLLPFLQHPKCYVREGAILGLQTMLAISPGLAEQLEQLAESDESPGVRAVASESLQT